MREARGDLFELARGKVLCLTTNGTIKRSGECVMGAGCAKQAAKLWPDAPMKLGSRIAEHGNAVMSLDVGLGDYKMVFAFPVKHNWWEVADIKLIEHSASQLKAAVDSLGLDEVYVPRPGCGNGGLEWAAVRPVIEPYFDDRFILVSF
jgi:hypothetical protein